MMKEMEKDPLKNGHFESYICFFYFIFFASAIQEKYPSEVYAHNLEELL